MFTFSRVPDLHIASPDHVLFHACIFVGIISVIYLTFDRGDVVPQRGEFCHDLAHVGAPVDNHAVGCLPLAVARLGNHLLTAAVGRVDFAAGRAGGGLD